MTSVLSLLLDLPILYTMAVFTARERRELARVIESDRERERELCVPADSTRNLRLNLRSGLASSRTLELAHHSIWHPR